MLSMIHDREGSIVTKTNKNQDVSQLCVKEKTGKSCDFSGLVEQVLEISNGFIDGFKATIGFKTFLIQWKTCGNCPPQGRSLCARISTIKRECVLKYLQRIILLYVVGNLGKSLFIKVSSFFILPSSCRWMYT